MKFLLLAIFLVGCAGAPEKKTSAGVDPAQDVNLKNDDFAKKKALTYSANQDYYNAPKGSPSGNVLINESAGKANSNELKSLVAGKDPLAVMMSLCYKKSFEEAFGIAESIFSSHMNIPTYWNQVATCHLLQGNERKALLFYNKALEVTPNYVPALNNIGVIYNKNKQDQKSQVALQRALNQGKFTKTPRFNLAYLLLEYGLAGKALPLFKGLSDDAPSDPDLRVGLANCYALLARWDEAWEQFNAIPDKRRKRADVGLNMALTAHRLGKSTLAKDIFNSTEIENANRKYASSIQQLLGE